MSKIRFPVLKIQTGAGWTGVSENPAFSLKKAMSYNFFG
jgi:hypothetical protein